MQHSLHRQYTMHQSTKAISCPQSSLYGHHGVYGHDRSPQFYSHCRSYAATAVRANENVSMRNAAMKCKGLQLYNGTQQ